MTDDRAGSGYKLLEHPDVQPVLEIVARTIIGESDRGAVLVSTSIVDEYLRTMFEKLASPQMSNKKRRELLDYPGPLSSLAAKADIALLTQLIDAPLNTAIHRLRRLRNSVAHDTTSFRLSDHQATLRQISDLGPGVPAAVNNAACEFLVQSFLRNIEEVETAKPEQDRLFRSPREALDALADTPASMELLQERAWRVELGIAVGIVCAMIVFYWERPSRA